MILKKLVCCVIAGSCLAVTQGKATHKSSLYTVTESDDDEIIAKKLDIKLSNLHQANPNVNWNRMRPGSTIKVPSGSSTQKNSVKSSSHTYIVTESDDDFRVARKAGIKLSLLHQLNPSVDWNRMRPGLKLNLPSSKDFSSSSQTTSNHRTKRIRTNRAQTCCDDVTVRSQPSTSGVQLTQIELDSVGKIIDREKGWYKIRFKKDVEGWVRGDMLKPYQTINSSKFEKKRSSQPLIVASKNKKKKHKTRRNRATIITEKELQDIKDPSIIKFAKQYLGVRYRYSGTSARGFDCSGFTSHVYKRHGISLPHSSRKQSSKGRKISASDLKTGDLVFFKTNGRSRVNHVGIYMSNGKFIHASSGGGKVQVNKLNEGYYSRRFAGGRRVR